MMVVGVDGCKKGWIAVATKSGKFNEARFFTKFSELLDAYSTAKVIVVDIPIGFPKREPRQADVEAKKFLEKRSSSVFLTPPEEVLWQTCYEKARKVSKRFGHGVSAQAYALRKKILEVKKFALKDQRLHEVHPEVSFKTMAEDSVLPKKKTWQGLHARLRLLRKNGIELPDDLGEAGEKAGPDDIVHAAAAAWTAGRIARKTAKTMPAQIQETWKGRPIAIWF